VRLLKRRPDIERLHGELARAGGGAITFPVFEKFARETQKVRRAQACRFR